MKKKPGKIITLMLILLLTTSGFSGAQYTNAYFNDMEISSINTFSASSLDFSLASSADFTPEIGPGVSDAERSVNVSNNGELGFQYTLSVINPRGILCSNLNLSASLGGRSSVVSSISTFNVGPFVFDGPENWDFTATLVSNAPEFEGTTCVFDLQYIGWQENLVKDAGGFTDIETILSTVTATRVVALDEIHPGSYSASDNSIAPFGREWVEIYNSGNSPVDMLSWFVKVKTITHQVEAVYSGAGNSSHI